MAARDRFGVKPLYYQESNKSLLLSSEISPLIDKASQKDIDHQGLITYLSEGSTIGETTLFYGVKQLEPGRYMRFNTHSGVKTNKIKIDISTHRSENPIEESIRDQIPDVSYGIMYSGGIDSTIVLKYTKDSEYLDYLLSISVDHVEMSEKSWQELGIAAFPTDHAKHLNILSGVNSVKPNALLSYSKGLDLPMTHQFHRSIRHYYKARECGLKVLLWRGG